MAMPWIGRTTEIFRFQHPAHLLAGGAGVYRELIDYRVEQNGERATLSFLGAKVLGKNFQPTLFSTLQDEEIMKLVLLPFENRGYRNRSQNQR
jgi:hypothetical protein